MDVNRNLLILQAGWGRAENGLVDWIEKLNLLRDRRSLAQIEKDAGWPLNSLSTAISSKSVPNAAKAIKLARALHVQGEWLFDDEKEWPPPSMQMPPVSIMPWPPYGITWEEMQIAISEYIYRRTMDGLRKMNEDRKDKGVVAVIGPCMPLFPSKESAASPDKAAEQAMSEPLANPAKNDNKGRGKRRKT